MLGKRKVVDHILVVIVESVIASRESMHFDGQVGYYAEGKLSPQSA